MYLMGRHYQGYSFHLYNAVVRDNVFDNNGCYGIIADEDEDNGFILDTNVIHVTPLPGYENYAVALAINANFSEVTDNTITGSGYEGIEIYDYFCDSHSNLMDGNRLGGFTPVFAHYYLLYRAHKNTIIGSNEPGVFFIDDGYDNTFSGFLTPAPASSVSENTRKNFRKNFKDIQILK